MKSRTKRRTNKTGKSRKNNHFFQFGGGQYNNTKKYIDLSHIKQDLQKLVTAYANLEQAYKIKHGEVMTLYQSYMDLYQDAKRSNNKSDENQFEKKIFGINNTIMNQEKKYHKERDMILGEINHIRDYIRDNKQYFIQKLGINKSNNNNLYTFNDQGRDKIIEELKVIEENNDNQTHKCPKCQKMGMGVIMIPEPQPRPQKIINQHIYVKQPQDNNYKCPMCMHVQCHQQPVVNQQILNLSSLLNQRQNQQPLQNVPKSPTKQDMCMEEALRNPKSGMDLQTQIQQCMMQENVSLSEIDVEYLKKHNELMSMYKAYQQLYIKVNEYKNKLDNIKSVRVSSILTREQLSKMVGDQQRIMSSLGTMQQNMVERGILNPSETVNVDKYDGRQLQELNANLGQQLNSIVNLKQPDNVDEQTKKQIAKLIEQQKKEQENKGQFKGKIMQIMGMGTIPTHSLANNSNVSNVNLYKM